MKNKKKTTISIQKNQACSSFKKQNDSYPHSNVQLTRPESTEQGGIHNRGFKSKGNCCTSSDDHLINGLA
jgi:hypothetical protein